MEKTLRVGCLQMCSRADPLANLERLDLFIKEAVEEEVDLLLSPEAALYMPKAHNDHWERGWYFPQETHEGLRSVCKMVADAGLWFVLGSLGVLLPDKRLASRSFVIAPDGSIKGSYDKIHLFDAVSVSGDIYHESQKYKAGEYISVVATEWGKIGIGMCYDLRFPHLFHEMACHGACFLTVPSAFDYANGMLHWSILVRCRAIETGSYMFAPAQAGTHENGRKTYGHSMIVSPWGEILASTYNDQEKLIVADIDPAAVHQARSMLPVLEQTRNDVSVRMFS